MWDKVVIALLLWGVTVYKFGAMWRDGQWRDGSVTFYFWSFSFFTAIGITLLVGPIYTAVNTFWSVANLAWLIKYVAFCLAIYYMASGCYLALKQQKPRPMSWSLAITLTILIGLYIVGISTLPEKAEHTIPETWLEMLFMQTMYVYMLTLCIIPFVTFVRLFRQEEIVATQLRWAVGVTASLLATVVLSLKITLTFLAFTNPTTGALPVLQPIININFIAAGLLCPLAFLPNRFYIAVAQPYLFLGQVKALHDLSWLQKQLDSLCPPVINTPLDFRTKTQNPDFYLYRSLIAILDAKRMLDSYHLLRNEKTTPISSLGNAARKWDEQQWQLAGLLQRELAHVDDEQAYGQLIQAYQQVGWRVWWHIYWYSLWPRGRDELAYQE